MPWLLLVQLIGYAGTVTYNVNVSNTLGFRDHFVMIDTFYSIKLVIRVSEYHMICKYKGTVVILKYD